MKNRAFTSAPLPFQGQKRFHIKPFSAAIQEASLALIIDLFGGSGLLSHVAKQVSPTTHVIYNDYDNFRERLQHIEETNALLGKFREMLSDIPRGSRLDASSREAVCNRLAAADKTGYVDWITLSSSLRFSMRYATSYKEFCNDTLYNRPRFADYDASGYLDGLEVVRCDYRELLRQYRHHPDVLFIADPPYLSTDVSTYGSKMYWHLRDYLNILTELKGLRFVYFTSNKSQILELCDWMSERNGIDHLFAGATRTAVKSSTSFTSSYEDIMLCKLH